MKVGERADDIQSDLDKQLTYCKTSRMLENTVKKSRRFPTQTRQMNLTSNLETLYMNLQ